MKLFLLKFIRTDKINSINAILFTANENGIVTSNTKVKIKELFLLLSCFMS
ncbi:hypothetical protein GCM10022388_16430 [Flavobacterium chungnamense]|uniref:Uncharacterized protein n=1 Tax=Flavobacterium chungnamense TaxID=706182 RepID=A0ABP7URY3_9FLAO